MMVGAEVALPKAEARAPGGVLFELREVSTPAEGRRVGLDRVNLALRERQILGIAGVSGNGQGALADLIGGLAAPGSGEMLANGAPVGDWSPRASLDAGVGRIPEDRHALGSVADFTLTENAVLERYNTAPFSRAGIMDWAAARRHAEEIIAAYDVRCPGPDTRIRLLSGGNMQKLILGRVMEGGPRVLLANQPVRGLDIGALTYVQTRLIAARDAGAAVLLISEDLDEILALADVVHVMSEGRLSPGFMRGSKSPAELGVWMAGQGFEHAA
jgi:simple sugar transport system ATP-binding protein